MKACFTVAAGEVSLRQVQPEDRPFLLQVYGSTRADELAVTGWTEQQCAAFVQMQFEAQSKYCSENYPGAEFYIISVAGESAGRLYLHRRPQEIRIMDIALLPAFRGLGIGTGLLKQILSEVEPSGQKVSIHVEGFNRAMRLYERMGFRKVSANGPYFLMEWYPAEAGCCPENLNTELQKA